MELSELSLRVGKLEEIIQELAKWTNFNLSLKLRGTTDNFHNEKGSHPNKNGRFGNLAKSAGEREEDSSVVIKMELEEDEDDADAISGQFHEDDDKELQNKNGQASSVTVFRFDPFEDPPFNPSETSDVEEAEYSGAESALMETPEKRRRSAKRKYEPLKVPPTLSLPPSAPFVSLRPLTSSQILPHLQKKKEIPSEIKNPIREFKTTTDFNTQIRKGSCRRDDRTFACPHCSYVAKNKKTLSSHFLLRHPTATAEASALPFKCPACPKTFKLKRQLSSHFCKTHKNTEGNFLCDSCPYVGKNRTEIQTHFARIHKKPSLFCYFCSWVGRRKDHLENHMRTHTGEKPFNCPYCIYTSAGATGMKVHVKHIHKKEADTSQFQIQYSNYPQNAQIQGANVSSYKCEFCAFEGFTILSLKGHLKEHKIKKDKIFKCPHCPYAAATKKTLSVHIQSMHPKDGEESHRPFKCAECQKAFRFKDRLSSHIFSMHRIREKSFLCDSCPYLGPTFKALQEHIKRKHNKHPFLTCYFCPWRGKDFDKVLNHMRIHTGETPYKCPHCIFTSTQRITLKDHLKNAHGKEEGSFQCEKCSCRFKTLIWLKRHQRIHNIYANKCGICGFEAFNKDSLKEHLKCHKTKDGKMFQCPQCLKTFKSRLDIQRHVRIHNPYKCEKCSCSFQERSQLSKHKNACKVSRSDNYLKDKEGLPGQVEEEEPIASVPVPAQQVENSEDVITLISVESILGT